MKNWIYLIIYRLKEGDCELAEKRLNEFFRANYMSIYPGVGLLQSGPHAFHLKNQISLCLNKDFEIESLLIFHIDNDASIDLSMKDFAKQEELVSFLDIFR